MIITCNNCNKKFNIDSNLIPDKGRLLQCASCDHKWFFKKEVLENTVSPIDEDISIDSVNIFDKNNSSTNEEESVSDVPNDDVEVDLEEESKKKIEININDSTQVNAKTKKQKNIKILNIIIVAIISFVAFIIIVDTFKYPIGQVVPNIEIILYNLYESIKDISLFIRDLT
ncbi:zinc-ribbon domain-containing protein [Candidatus Pelagibacter sp. Uisw_092]|uniref:zinc-ribbon domain-containing protein n=1 Tax=Candidatus Pelagibacter sp. Uisw_092 TaxID=3230979 RepID=UPI0039E97EC8